MHCKRSKLLAVVSEHDLKRLISHTASDGSLSDLHDAVTIVKNTGVRAGELARLRWSDIDMKRHRFIVLGKNSSTRYTFFADHTLAILRARRQRQPDAEFVFGPSMKGGRLSTQLRRVSKTLGISHATFRTLRHTCAMRLFASGAQPAVLWYLLGVRDQVGLKSFISEEQTLKCAAQAQAKIEDAQRPTERIYHEDQGSFAT